MRTPDTSSRRAPAVAAAALALAGLAFLLHRPAMADDRDLLRFDGAKPYLFILLDTSASMSLGMGEDAWTPGWADGPGSRLYQAKQALYNVLQDVDDVQFGFASYNQDGVHVTGKHYTYYNPEALPTDTTNTWAIPFPAGETADVDGDGSMLTQLIAVPRLDSNGNPLPIDPDIDEKDTRVLEIAGDVLTFGQNAGSRVAGTCSSPLLLTDAEDRAKLQGLPIDGATVSGAPTRMWIRSGSRTYLLEITVPGNDADGVAQKIGDPNLFTKFELRRVNTGNSCSTNVASVSFDKTYPPFNRRLASDPQLFETLVVDGPSWEDGDGETIAGVASFSDVFSDADFENSRPFTGKGWEGNYDSGVVTGDSDLDTQIAALEAACGGEPCDFFCDPSISTCVGNVKHVSPTVVSNSFGRALDKGDLLPFDWEPARNHKHDFLQRLSPSHTTTSSGLGDYRLAKLFGDTQSNGALPLLVPDRRPLLAADHSPLAKSLNDFRCWYLGEEGRGGSNKCKDTTFVEFGTGWEEIACVNDSEFGCRRPYLIIISDGEDTGGRGEDANADIAALNSHSGVRTWALNVGDPRGCDSGGGLHPIVRAGGGECIVVDTQAKLRQTLQSILGEIRTEARSFASAAVPSVQATVEQKIFLTSFVPLNDSSVWDGHLHAFIKSLPTTGDGRPDTSEACTPSSDPVNDPTDSCHLWDAGEVLKLTQYPASGSEYLDLADPDLRRVFYAARLLDDASAADDVTEPGEWPDRMRLFRPLSIGESNDDPTRAWRHDLWRAMGIDFDEDESADPHVNDAAATEANAAVDHTLHLKTGTVNEVDPETGVVTPRSISFLLGDVFHSTPIVVGTPPNTLYFAADLYGDGDECEADDGTGTANPGYRCFFDKQRFRRKMLLVGSNDGMLHAFDAGIFRTTGTDAFTGANFATNNGFDNGTGKELFGFIPRPVMETLKGFAGSDNQAYTVDGTVTVADVFIDPLDDTASAFPDATDREWRTVAVGGLREGGAGYYALDVTQPDPVEESEERFVPTNRSETANVSYVPKCSSGLPAPDEVDKVKLPTDAACGPVPFPAVLWEFDDRHYDPLAGAFFHADEDNADGEVACSSVGNGEPDLGASWSTPNVGRIRVCQKDGTACDPADPENDDHLVDRFVAVFGGGMDVANKSHDWRQGVPAEAIGNWLYMVDVETGQVIYKQPLEGAAPSEPAAVDTNGDGYLDTIYLGTLAGYLYRVDLGPVGGVFPALEAWDICLGSGATTESVSQDRLPFDVWKPIKVFDTNFDGSTATALGTRPRSIYHRPSVIFSAGTGRYALAFGTGDRENLWTVGPPLERFYVFNDTVAAGSSPLNEGALEPIDALTSPTAATSFLATGGWVLRLAEDERVITDAFALSGVLIFSAFTPSVVDQDGTPVNVGCGEQGNQGGGGGGPNQADRTCSKQGTSAIFVVNATNANGLLFEGEDSVRFREVPTFVTNPFAEPGQKKTAGDGDDDDRQTADDLSEDLLKVMNSLKTLFPEQCKFANYRVDVKTIAADTSLQFIAPIPVCLIERNWKEF